MLLILVGKWVLIWWVREAYPPYKGSGEGFYGGCAKFTHPTGEAAMGFMVGARSLSTLQGKWQWVHGGCAKLTHPTREVAMGFMVGAQAYPPYRGSGDGFYGGCAKLTHPTKPWAHRRAGKRSAPALTPRPTPALPKTHSPWVIALNTPATATAPGSSTPSRLSLPT